MTREEFESILEEAYIEGYNTALEDIQEDILDEEAYDLEGEYGVYCEKVDPKVKGPALSKMADYPKGHPLRKTLARLVTIQHSDRDYPNAQKYTPGKIEKDYKGNIPDKDKGKLISALKRIRKDKDRGDYPSKSAFLKD